MQDGDFVHYVPGFGKLENGRIKSIDEDSAFVVYHCNDEWSRFREYVGQKTHLNNLRPGWVDDENNPISTPDEDLQKHGQEILKIEDMILVKIHDHIYSSWWDLVYEMLSFRARTEAKQKVIFEKLIDWVESYYPGHTIAAFEDLSRDEASVVSRKIGKEITWGMYVLLQKGGKQLPPVSLTNKLLGS